jgi:hypothetical protein
MDTYGVLNQAYMNMKVSPLAYPYDLLDPPNELPLGQRAHKINVWVPIIVFAE